MKAYITKLAESYSAFVQSPSGRYIELRSYGDTEAPMREYLTDLGYQVLNSRPV